jgi:putative phosphoesterase
LGQRWLVTADTHWVSGGRALPPWLLAAAARADAIVHAGDLVDPALLEILAARAPTWAVAGNGDPAGDPRLPAGRLLELDGLRIGVTHGHLGPPGATTPQRAAAAFAGQRVDLVIFGHSHQPLFAQRGSLWLLNPGSPTQRRRAPTVSAAWLAVGPGMPAVDWLGPDATLPG